MTGLELLSKIDLFPCHLNTSQHFSTFRSKINVKCPNFFQTRTHMFVCALWN